MKPETKTQSVDTLVASAVKRDDLVPTYADILRRTFILGERVDVGPLNRAIIDRWSVSALEYIKRLAWKRASGG